MTPRRRRLTDEQVRKLKVKAKRYTLPDPELVGHYVRVMPTGAKSFVAVARSPFQKKNEKGVLVHEQVWITLAPTDHLKIEAAREKAREAIARVKRGQPAIEPPPPAPDTFKAVADNWFKRHVEAKALRTRHEIERCLSKYVLPTWRDRVFDDIRRSDVALLLDHIEDAHGSRQADATLTIVRSMMNWYASRSDDYVVPVARGMKRSTNGARERILNDDEIPADLEVRRAGRCIRLARPIGFAHRPAARKAAHHALVRNFGRRRMDRAERRPGKRHGRDVDAAGTRPCDPAAAAPRPCCRSRIPPGAGEWPDERVSREEQARRRVATAAEVDGSRLQKNRPVTHEPRRSPAGHRRARPRPYDKRR